MDGNIKIVIGSWGSYNECNERALGSKWLDLSDYTDWEQITDELKEEGFILDGIDEELFIQDVEGLPSGCKNWDYTNPQTLFETLCESGVLDDESYHSIIFLLRSFFMIFVGIDVSKDKHDCCILSQDGQVLAKPFSVPNSIDGFNVLFAAITSCESNFAKVKVGLEATGHYSFNILGYLLDKDLACYVFNPLHTNLYRKSLTLKKDPIICK